jgi:hypothetical protein
VRGLRAHGGGARLVGEQRLRPHLAREVLDFLLAGQHPGLLESAAYNCTPTRVTM